jgi:hypothetical protein
MFVRDSFAGLLAKVALVVVYALAVAIGQWEVAVSSDDSGFLQNAFRQGTQLHVRFGDEVCTFTNLFVGDGAIRVASRCSDVHGDGGSR